MKIPQWFLLSAVFLVFWVEAVGFLDPDFGWHLQTGNFILKNGIPKTDPFSYTMPSYPFVDHEWLTDVLLAKVYSWLGMPGLATIAAGLGLGALLAAASAAKTQAREFGLIPLLLGAGGLLPFMGVRPQVISWFLLAVLLRIAGEKDWKKWRLLTPLLFAVWANLHGGFAAGLGSLLVLVVLRALRRREISIVDTWVFVLSLLGTLFNPYGVRLWGVVWSSVSDTSLRWMIREWNPIFFGFDFPVLGLMALSVILVWRYRRRVRFEIFVLFWLFLLQGIASLRNLPLWTVIALPTATWGIGWLGEEVMRRPLALGRFRRVLALGTYGAIGLFLGWSLLNLFGSDGLSYPEKAVGFLRKEPWEGQLFSEYGWGGYLIWKLPEKKVFIDGRMPSWRWKAPNKRESDSAFREYQDLFVGKVEPGVVFSKYNVETALLGVWERKSPLALFGEKVDLWVETVLGRERTVSLAERLQRAGWREVYRDGVAVLYRKPGTF